MRQAAPDLAIVILLAILLAILTLPDLAIVILLAILPAILRLRSGLRLAPRAERSFRMRLISISLKARVIAGPWSPETRP